METVRTNVETDRGSVDDDSANIRKRVVGVTKGGKEILIHPIRTGYYSIKFKQGGELPRALKGTFTKYDVAEGFVKQYLDTEPEPKPAKKATVNKKKETASNAKNRNTGKSKQLSSGEDIGLQSDKSS